MAEIAKQREIMLAERRRRDRGHAVFFSTLLAAVFVSHWLAFYVGGQIALSSATPPATCPPVLTPKPANQVLGCREVWKLCRAELQHPKGQQ